MRRHAVGDRVIVGGEVGTVVELAEVGPLPGVFVDIDRGWTVIATDRECESEADCDPDLDVEDGVHEWHRS